VLLDYTAGPAPAVQRVYAELALYVQAAGITVLRLTYPWAESRQSHAEHVLAAVNLLRSAGIERATLITATTSQPASMSQTTTLTLEGFLEALTSRSTTMGEFASGLGELLDAICATLETVVGTATVLVTPPAAAARRTPARTRARRTDRGRRDETASEAPTSGTAQLVMAVPGAAAGDRSTLGTLARLYTWTTNLLRDAEPAPSSQASKTLNGTPSSTAAGEGPRATGERQCQALASAVTEMLTIARMGLRATTLPGPRTTWQQRLSWLDEQWVRVLVALEGRAPERAAQIHALTALGDRSGAAHEPSAALRDARLVWSYLDTQARKDWLGVCAQVFPLSALPAS
jgi:hypothetical protein